MEEIEEPLKQGNLVSGEFPYPKLVKLFDYYFPKLEGHEKINWQRLLEVWSRWAPWITVLLLILICCFMAQESIIAGFACMAFIASFLSFACYLVLAFLAKLAKRSPRILLALTPRVPFFCILGLSLVQLLFWIGSPSEKALERERAEKKAKWEQEQERRKREEEWWDRMRKS